jgi:hypothetical protein
MYPSITSAMRKLQEQKTHLGTKTGLPVQGLDDQDETSGTNLLQCLLVNDVEGRFVDQSNVNTVLSEPVDRVEGSVDHISVCDNVSFGSLSDELILARLEFVVFVVVSGSILLQNEGNLGSSGEDESDTLVVEDLVNNAI